MVSLIDANVIINFEERKGLKDMSTLKLTQKIEMLPQEEYAMVETYVNRISELVAKKQQEKAWAQIKKDLAAAEKSIREEGTVSFSDMRKSLGV